ncbi:hypothetical protein [Pedobacter nutrimenti]|uniref:hypothetical protein n=1 Tax=Pedobacter nutrimenti TaxID=1241337 RepID=UPI00293173DD|nr:hypothetical protein [Pedobacter nutrimenti]
MKSSALKSSLLIKLALLIMLFAISSCKSTQKSVQILFPPPIIAFTDLINFCDLPNHNNESIYVRSIYSKIDGRWTLRADNKNCKDLKVEFKIADGAYVNDEHLLKEIDQKPPNFYFIIDAIGTFKLYDTKRDTTTGSNSGEFIAEKILVIQKIASENETLVH